jgi:hypothetical protein
VIVERPDVPLPRVPIVALEGIKEATCGEPGRAEPMRSTIWTTQTGRFFILSVRDSPRKYLFDSNGDGTIELEAWDIDGDGHFEARRTTSFAIPAELLPAPPIRPDSLTTDSLVASGDSTAATDSAGVTADTTNTAADTTGTDTTAAAVDTTGVVDTTGTAIDTTGTVIDTTAAAIDTMARATRGSLPW